MATEKRQFTEEHRRHMSESRKRSPKARAAYDMLRVLRRGKPLPQGAAQRSNTARWMRNRGLDPRAAPELFDDYVRLRSGA